MHMEQTHALSMNLDVCGISRQPPFSNQTLKQSPVYAKYTRKAWQNQREKQPKLRKTTLQTSRTPLMWTDDEAELLLRVKNEYDVKL